MKYFIELSDSRNAVLKRLLEDEGLEVFEYDYGSESFGDVLIFAPAKKWTAELAERVKDGVKIFAGRGSEEILAIFRRKRITYINFLKDQEFAIRNANLTAEGMLSLLVSETEKSIFELKILMLGLGRVGKAAAILFGKLGLDLSAVSFRSEDFADSALYVKHCYSEEEYKGHLGEFDVIINNVPESILEDVVQKIAPGTLVMEIASVHALSGKGADHFKYLVAPGLPQKFSCKSAARLMKKLILKKSNEVN